ncbi:MAG TPA: glycoside hydrolase domain-containing protein [Pseudonocardiaceae bacterium]
MTIWADYSAGRPGGTALRAAGFSGVIRYVGTPGRTKNITAGEYQDLVGHSMSVLLVHENATGDVLRGYAGGVADAHAALNNARACSIPDSVGIASASDRHLTAAQVRVGVQYQAGFASVLGVERTGAYGFHEFISAVRAAHSASWLWQCGTRPVGNAGVHLWQRNTGASQTRVNRIACDINDQLLPLPEDDMTPDEAQVASMNALRAFFNGDLYPSMKPNSTEQAPLARLIQNSDMFGYQLNELITALTTNVSALNTKVDALATLVTAMATKKPATFKDEVLGAIEDATRKVGGFGATAEHAIENVVAKGEAALGHKS